MRRMAFFIVWIVVFASAVYAADKKAELEVRDTLSKFIEAFDNLDWDRFHSFFSDDATVFYPRGVADRANGRTEIEANFRKVFETIRGNQTHPPYMRIVPRELKIQVYADTAIATFYLDDRPDALNRRTIVLHKTAAGWKIVHLHASEVLSAGGTNSR